VEVVLMRPDLPQEDFDGLVRRHEELTRTTRVLYHLDTAPEETSGSPFELMADIAKAVVEVFVIAVIAVALVAYLLSKLPPGSMP
jgi:hypothetical protein